MPTAWKGSVSFGLVNIPITLHAAAKSGHVEFHMLHRRDRGRIGYQKVCKKCGAVLEPQDIVKAVERGKDDYLTVEKEELEQGKAEITRNLEVSLFVKEEEIDSKLYESPYYAMPAKGAEKLYVLLRETIRASGRVGIGKIQFGNREHLAALAVEGPAILLDLMHFPEEMEELSAFEFPPMNAAVDKKELDLAKRLVDSLKGEFRAEDYRNVHRERLEEMIRAKAEESPIPAAAKDGRIIDLMERLKRSLEGSARSKPSRAGVRASHARAVRPSAAKPGAHPVKARARAPRSDKPQHRRVG